MEVQMEQQENSMEQEYPVEQNQSNDMGTDQDNQENNGPSLEDQLEEELRNTDAYRVECIQSRKFAEAQKAHDRVEELKVEIYEAKKQSLIEEQQRERQNIESEQMQHLETFEQEWNEHEETLRQESESQLAQIDERHAKELEDFKVEIEEKLPRAYKPSAKLLNTRKIQDTMIIQKQYQEAQELEDESLGMEEEEQANFEENRQKKMQIAENQLLVKQANERAALEKKLLNLRNERATQKKIEHDRIVKKFTNMVRDLDNKQQISQIRLASLHNKKPDTRKGSAKANNDQANNAISQNSARKTRKTRQ